MASSSSGPAILNTPLGSVRQQDSSREPSSTSPFARVSSPNDSNSLGVTVDAPQAVSIQAGNPAADALRANQQSPATIIDSSPQRASTNFDVSTLRSIIVEVIDRLEQRPTTNAVTGSATVQQSANTTDANRAAQPNNASRIWIGTCKGVYGDLMIDEQGRII